MALQQGQQALKVLLENIPKELQQFNNFVMWKATQLEGSDTLTKVPYNAKTGRKAKVTDPNSWSTFEQVSKSYNRGTYSGIGLVIEESMNLVAIDIDNVSDPATDERVKPLLEATYCELSPSGKGIRAFIFGDVGTQYQPSFNNREAGYEAYTSKRYVTLTGGQVSSVSAIATDTGLINSIYSQYGEEYKPNKDYEGLTLESIKRTETPKSEVFKRIKKANSDKKERILALYKHGADVMNEYGFESQSDADYSLISDLLFYADNDYGTVNEIMIDSALYRDKYDSPRRFILDGSITASYGFNSIIKLAIEYNNKKTYSEYVSENRASASEEFEVYTVDDPDFEGWGEKLQRHPKTEAILPTRKNVELILRNDPYLKDTYRLNVFSGVREIDGLPQWRHPEDDTIQFRDSDEAAIRNRIGVKFNIEADKKVADIVTAIAEERRYNPVAEYLNSLEWDGVERLESFFIDYLGAEDSTYTRRVTEATLVAAVRRIFDAGCKYDNCLVLYGPQGAYKSYSLKRLGKQWFTDSPLDIGSKEAFITTKGKWIIEISEMSSMSKKSVNEVKAYLSSQEDTYREAYQRYPVTVKRQSIAIATTNDAEFLKDSTGGRRFWPLAVAVKKPELSIFEASEEIINQVWAEAVHKFKAGVSIYLDPVKDKDVLATATMLQEKHTVDDGIKSSILEYINNPLPDSSRFLYPENLHLTYEQDGKRYVSRLNAKIIYNEAMSSIGSPDKMKTTDINRVLNSLDILEKKDSIRLLDGKRGRGFIIKERYLTQ
ncbi:VapE domain-containing protein [Macrococcus equi]|uniref:phage NrS-1 polymerase family protein n=1 Tax=Macrococcus equi TaxID=3395462 RepID=UPI0039BDEA86